MYPRDALVYRAIVRLVESDLLRGLPSWVGFKRTDKAPGADDPVESLGWFERWMRHEGMLPNLLERDDIELVVQSDISNFFPSIRIEVIREHLASTTSLDATLVRLCCQIIAAAHPRADYADDSFLGLPQEIHNSSRTIAQTILKPVDDVFAVHGAEGRYSRYMDDVLWGVADSQEALAVLASFQTSLERLGLYPNVSKTRVLSKSEFIREYMVETNARLDKFSTSVETLLKPGNTDVVPPQQLAELGEIARIHRRGDTRADKWPRVSRRIYTLQRRLGVKTWSRYWLKDFQGDPAGGPYFFEYMRAWPLTMPRVAMMAQAADGFGGLYADIEVMFAETVSTAPVGKNLRLWSAIYDFAHARFEQFARDSGASIQAAAWFVAAAKFGNDAQRAALVAVARRLCATSMPAVMLQAAALDPNLDLAKTLPASLFGVDEGMAVTFFDKVRAGDGQYVGVIKSLLAPTVGLAPLRATIRPRALLLLDRLGQSGNRDPKLLAKHLAAIQKNEPRLRDHRSEELLSRWVVPQ